MLRHGNFGNDNYKFIFETNTEKPLKKCQNFGNILIYTSFCNQNNLIWKNGVLKKKIPKIFEINFKKYKKFDLRDLCLKRGLILRKLEMKIFIFKKLKFDFLKLLYRFSFISLKKDLVFKNRKFFFSKNPNLKEKTQLKGFFQTNILNNSINKISFKNFKKKSKEIILNLYSESPTMQENFLIKTNFQDIKIDNFDLFILLRNLALKKMFFFLTFLD